MTNKEARKIIADIDLVGFKLPGISGMGQKEWDERVFNLRAEYLIKIDRKAREECAEIARNHTCDYSIPCMQDSKCSKKIAEEIRVTIEKREK